MQDLLQSVNLSNVLWNKNQENDIDAVIYDYNIINTILTEKIKFSKQFLTQALANI